MVGPLRQQDPIQKPKSAPLFQGFQATPKGKPEEKLEPMSIGGFIENLGENTREVVSGVMDAFTVSAKSAAYIIKNAELLGDIDPEFLAQDLKNVGKALVHSITDKYQKYGARALYEKPVDVVGDAATLLSAGGGAAGKLGQVAKMPKLEAAGKAIAAIPGKVAGAVTEAPLRAIGINPKLRKVLTTYEREERAIGELTKKKLGQVLDEKFKGFSDQDKALLDKLAVEGGNAAELAANPRVKDALDAYHAIVREIREKQLGEAGRRLLSADEMESAVVKKYANRKYGATDKETLLRSKAEIDAMDVKPVYTPAMGEGKQMGIMDLIWGPDEVRTGKVGFLEPFKGGKFGQDPVAYMRKAINDFVDTETRLRFMDRVIQDPKLTRAVRNGEGALGHVVPEGIFKKYFDDKARSQAIGVRDTQLKHGIQEAERLLTSDPVTQKYVRSIAAVGATDPTVASYLKWTFTKASGKLGAFLRVYDKVINAFKLSATTLNPRYYTGNIVGDAILSTMAGEYGLHWRSAKRIIDSLPPELRAGGRAVLSENPLLAKFQNLAQIAQSADDLARAGIWTKEVASQFKQTGAAFVGAENAFDEFAKAVGNSVEDLSALQTKAQIMGEHIARSSTDLLRINTHVSKLEDAYINAQNKWSRAQMEGKDVTKLQEKAARIHDRLYEAREVQEGILAKARQQFVQSGEYHARIPEAAKYAEVARQATDRANTFLGEYLALGPIERGVFRRVVPFYAFTKAMTKLAFTYPLIAPKTSFFWHRYSQAMADMATDEDIPEYMAGYFPAGGFENGDTFWIRLSQLGPFGGVRMGRAGDMPVPSLLQFWNQNPGIRLGYRLVGGRDEWYWAGKPKAGQIMVSAGDGTVNRFRPDGKLENVVPQMSPTDALATFFPVVQVVEQLFKNYDVMKGDVQTPTGEPKYPIGAGTKALRLIGISAKTGTAEDFRRGEKFASAKVIRNLVKDYPRMDPKQKEDAKQYIQDYVKGYYREFRPK